MAKPKISKQEVLLIRQYLTKHPKGRQYFLARWFGVGQDQISRIKNNRRRTGGKESCDRTEQERFVAFIDIDAKGQCWEWNGHILRNGYGQFAIAPHKTRTAHRYSYEMFKGSIPDDCVVMHKCDNRKCCNPDCLTIGTQQENVRDAMNKGRMRWQTS